MSTHVSELRDEAALRWFIWRMEVAVVQATPLGIKSYFSTELLAALEEFGEIDLAASDFKTLHMVAGRNIGNDDVAVFAEGELVGFFKGPMTGLSSTEVMLEILLPARDPRRGARRRAWVNGVVACAVNAVPSGAPPLATSVSTDDPLDILGVSRGADKKTIRAAYLARLDEYHPDRFERAGPKLKKLAEDETKKINAAYDELKRRAKDRHV